MPENFNAADIFDVVNRAVEKESTRDYDLDNWITDFEQAFPRFPDKVNPELREPATRYWGTDFENRPRIREMNPESDAQLTEGYRLIEFFPNRDIKEESYLLFGTPSELRIQVVLMMNLKRMLGGEGWVGFPFHDWVQASAGGLRAQIILMPNKQGVNYAKDPYWSKRQVSIPSPDRTKLTYDAIRTACGGAEGLTWGEWQARAYLIDPDRGTRHQMVAGGPTQERAKQNLDRFLPFSKCEPKNYSYNQMDFNRGERAKDPLRVRRQSLEVFPSWLWIFNREALPVDVPGTSGVSTHQGRLQSRRFKLNLRDKVAPEGWADKLKDAFRDYKGVLVD